MKTTDLLSVTEIRRRLTASMVGRHIYLFGEVDSTNDRLRSLAREGAHEGTVLVAESQTAGRGRHGQPWFSPSGVNFYASVLLRRRLSPREVGVFSLLAALALADAIKDFGAEPTIKWPNDVLVGRKKVGASLLECAVRDDQVAYVILGVGANLNVDPSVLRAAVGAGGGFATSLAALTGRPVDRNAFAAGYLNHLDRWLSVHEMQGTAAILAAWRRREILGGRRVEVRGPGETYDGRVLGVDEYGNLLVNRADGRRHVLTSEEIRTLD
ncbi:MAG TPA: biotin--[acetyl-CoA-carboxylase] ligase [Methylomirabilota bacterium]|jgi:BirA family biotin operon repressor/biotin-[acetyl-CoA-carboxylase] ligase